MSSASSPEATAICVVGCSGFVGSHVANTLLAKGYRVHGTLRDASEENTGWLRRALGDEPKLRLFSARLDDRDALARAMAGCRGVVMCAGTERQEPETIDLMVGAAQHVTSIAAQEEMAAAVFTSSTGSTNPKSGEPEIKNETDHWSDPDFQIERGKYSPAAKTLMDRAVLEAMETSDGKLRTATINPSLIVGPAFQDEPVRSFHYLGAIIRGERMESQIPNGSMSLIDVRDLAGLHVAALERDDASGRYFGVKQSWHWIDILRALEDVCRRHGVDYTAPPNEIDHPIRPTQFDLSRQRTLGVELRDLPEMLDGVVAELSRRNLI